MISWNLNSNNPEVGTLGHILVSAEGFQERDSRKDMYHEKTCLMTDNTSKGGYKR